jgi:hypothetical protein
MKNQRNMNLVICSGLALALALVIWSPVQALSAQPVDGNMMNNANDGNMMNHTDGGNMMNQTDKGNVINHTNGGMSGWTSGLIWTVVGVLVVVLLRVVTIKRFKK